MPMALHSHLDPDDAKAHRMLADGAFLGLGGMVNKPKSFDLMRVAADRGDAAAQTSLGDGLLSGSFWEGEKLPSPSQVEKDARLAAKWYKKAVEQGSALAMTRLAGLYQDGTGVRKNEKKALALLAQAAKLGDADAQKCLASKAKRVIQMEDRLLYGICCRYEAVAASKLCVAAKMPLEERVDFMKAFLVEQRQNK